MSNIGVTDDFRMVINRNPEDVFQQTTVSLGILVDANDPEGRGRWRVVVPSRYGFGEENFSVWAEPAGLPVGSCIEETKGDCGIWWPPVVGQSVLFGTIEGGDHQPFFIHGPVFNKEPGERQAMIPKEAKNLSENKSIRHGTRMRMLKSEAGHTLMFSDNEGGEALVLCDWLGQSFFMAAPSQGQAEHEDPESTKISKHRKGKTREDKSVLDDTGRKVDDTKNGIAYTGMLDANGSGVVSVATNGDGALVLKASKASSSDNPVSVVLDTKDNVIILTAGDTQLKIDGKRGHVYATSQIVQEHKKVDMKPMMKKIYNELKNFFKEVFGKGGSSSKQNSPQSPQSSQSPQSPQGPPSPPPPGAPPTPLP
ncbi:MAG: hypothetical protein ACP5RW_09150 [bacterium]